MTGLGRMLKRLAIVLLGTAAAAGAQTAPLPAAHPPCSGMNEIGADMNRPFTALMITNSMNREPDGTQRSWERIEFVARDNDGRIRLERSHFVSTATMHGSDPVTLYTRDGETIQTTRQDLGKSVIIQDCYSAKTIDLQPGMRIAHVTQGPAPAPVTGSRHPHNRATNLLSGKPQPHRSVEDLGLKQIEGVEARGVRLTDFGTADDGEWEGRPIKIFELWASDELGVTILQARTDLKEGSEFRSAFTNIKHAEPDASLFEVPAGYKINPAPDELPYQSDHGRLVELEK